MKKKYMQHLIVSIVFAIIVSTTLFFMYDSFKFQTFGEIVYYDYILSGSNDFVTMENVEVYCDQDNFYLNDGRILFTDSSILSQQTPTIKLELSSDEKKFNHEFTLDNYDQNNLIYSFNNYSSKTDGINLDTIKTATLTVEANNQELTKLKLDITPLDRLEGSNSEYRIENAAISKSMIRLGSLKTSNDNVFKDYSDVSLEYRYLKDKKRDPKDNDNYVVFHKISGTTKELINNDDYGTYNLEDDDIDLKNEKLSVVVILSNGDDNQYAFAIDLNVQEAGDYYG
ncbi:hypothetical protein [uncultured Thomasclavelia sp.]|uniref:hypothetical protein n=1 Tax=uncultured Thomasclavelia sp. TaxID=3025759 RepID=UPI002609A74B|nr:hypothetical protein [uncultured Thomasclavelia sp.]